MNTSNLILRKFTKTDFCDFSTLIQDKQTSPYSQYDEQFPTDLAQLQEILDYFIVSDDFFAIELKSNNCVIGFISLNYIDKSTRNLGFCIHSCYQGKGYGTEAVAGTIKYAKEVLHLHRLTSGTAKVNTPSMRLLQHAGFRIVSESEASFVNDEAGKPVIFMACSMEKIL